jgi:outer membrane protein insertion porin family
MTLASAYNSYDSRLTGGTLRAGFQLRDDLTVGLRYSAYLRTITIPYGLNDGCPGVCVFPALNTNEASIAVKQAAGSTITSLIGYSLIYNALDNNQNPSEGAWATLSQDLAGLGGDVRFVRTTLDARYYYPVFNDFTLMIRGQAGHVMAWGGQQLKIFDHFFRGGETIRGFATAGFGPRDLNSANLAQDALGGTMFWSATAELMIPLWFVPKDFGLRAAVFADAGSLWDYKGAINFPGIPPAATCPAGTVAGAVCLADSAKIRTSVGASIIWASPFGPLRLDYAIPITKEKYDKIQNFRFGGTTRF